MKKLFTRVVRTALLAMCALMALPASAADFTPGTWYIDMSQQDWFTSASAKFVIKSGNTEIPLYAVEGADRVFYFTLTSNATNIVINRNDPNTGGLWNSWTAYHDANAAHNCITLTGDGSYTNTTYTPSTPAITEVPSSMTVIYKDNSNSGSAEMKKDGNVFTYVLMNWYNGGNNNNLKFKFSDGTNTFITNGNEWLGFDTEGTAKISDDDKYWEVWNFDPTGVRFTIDFSNSLTNPKVKAEKATIETVKTPAIAQSGNQVNISCETEGAVIYYTLDGTTPSTNSPKYDGAFAITASCTVKAIAVKEGMDDSAVAEKKVAFTPEKLYLWYNDLDHENPSGSGDKCVELSKSGSTFRTTAPVHNYKYVIFSTSNTSWNADGAIYWGYATADYTPATLDNAVALTEGGHVFDATAGMLNFSVDFSDAANPSVLITPQTPHSLNIIGGLDSEEWDNTGKAMTLDGNIFTIENVTISKNFAFVNPVTGIRYGARGADVTLEFQGVNGVLTDNGYPRRRSQNVWTLADADKGQSYNIIVTFDAPGNPRMQITKYIAPLETPEKLYIIGSHIPMKWSGEWDATKPAEMTKEGDVFHYDVENYEQNTTGYFRLMLEPGENSTDWDMAKMYGPVSSSDRSIALNEYKEFAIGSTYDKTAYDFSWSFKEDKNGTFHIEVNFKTRQIRITFSEGTAINTYYLIGDVNKWLNDGTYKNGGIDYKYGYDPAQHGLREDWKLEECAAEEVPAKADRQDGETWYKLVIPEYAATPKALSGQFLVYKGTWNKKISTSNKIYYTPTWADGSFTTWAHNCGKNGEYPKDAYYEEGAFIKHETLFKNITSGKGLPNLKLANNYIHNATVYFCPDNNKLFVTSESEEDVKDIYVFYANSDDKSIEASAHKIKANSSSINNNNYFLKVDAFDGEMELMTEAPDGSSWTKTSDGKWQYNNVTYDQVWMKKLRPGMEGPAGQNVTVTLDAPGLTNNSNWAAVRGENIYVVDGIHVFVKPTTDILVSKVEFRIYGYSLDGSEIVVSRYDGKDPANGNAITVKDDPTGNERWTSMYEGHMSDGADVEGNHDLTGVWSAEGTGHFSSYNSDPEQACEIAPLQATKFIQFRVTYREVTQARDGMRRAEGADIVSYVPDYFATDTSNPAATWVLSGNHKLYAPGIETGIEDIFGDEFTENGEEVETIYYNLQGQRVNNPDKGLYIRVRGTKTDKVLF